jgi:hypothetical protein
MIHSSRNVAKMQRPAARVLVVPVDDRGRVTGRAPVYRAPNMEEAKRKIRDLMYRFPDNNYETVEISR